jgi:hypothetical protein
MTTSRICGEQQNVGPKRHQVQNGCEVRCKATYILRRSPLKLIENNGEPGGARTRDHRIKSAMLYQLSYRPRRYCKEGVLH